MRYFLFTLFILLTHLRGASQSIGNWETLFQDESIDLFVEIKISSIKDSCGDGMTNTHRFAYRVRQSLTPHEYYVSWKMDYLDCEGNPYCQERSFFINDNQSSTSSHPIESSDFLFASSKILKPHYDAAISYNLNQSNKNLIIPNSVEPKSIQGDNNIYLWQSTMLTVNGGVLGTGADWFWYKDQCDGFSVGKGKSIKVNPSNTTIYFVRAEGINNTTQCVQLTVNVDLSSTSPSRISAQTKMCKGDNNKLTVEGGSLGLGAEWVWYANDCNGQKIGTGETITVNPITTTVYYVRAEGNINKTNCASIAIEVLEKSLDPTSIFSIGSTIICEGTTIKLKVYGGELSNGAEWKWYSGSCYGRSLATGSEVDFTPLSSTTYFVRGEGYCNKTNCASLTITVNDKSHSPSYIFKSSDIYKNKKTTLSVSGGSLGKGAQWQWFKNSCSSGNPIGTGSTITVRTRKSTTYFVNAKGICNETSCAQTTIEPSKMHFWDHTYASKYKKFLEIGFGIGCEMSKFSEFGNVSISTNGNSYVNHSEILINGIGVIGIKGELPFYPFMKDYLSLGFIPAYSCGTGFSATGSSPPSFISTVSGDYIKTEEYYFYQQFKLETELAFGLKPVKFLVKHKRSIQYNDYRKTEIVNNLNTFQIYELQYTFNRNMSKEVISAGLRLGRYERKDQYKCGNNFDLFYTLSRNNFVDLIGFYIKDYTYLADWNAGAGFTWWTQSALKIQFEINLNSNYSNFNLNNFKVATYMVSLIYNRNWFY